MGLSFDDYQKMMKSGQIGWNMDIINGTAKQINDMSDLIRGQQTAAEPRLSPGNFQEVQRQYGQISGNVAYMRAYGNFLKQNSPEDYNTLSAHLGEIDRAMAPMKEWVNKGYDPQEYKQAEDARKLYAVREMRGGASAGDVEKKYGFKADEMQELYQNVLEYEKQEELSGKYDNKSVDELLEVIRDPDRLGQQVYNDIAKEYFPGDFQKMIKDKDYDWIFERYGAKYGLSAENVKNIVGQISNYDDKHYESMKGNAPKIADKDEREYILSRILEKGNGDELEKLRKSLPGENDPEYDNWKSLSSAVNDKLINERKMKQYYLDVKEKYPDASDDELEKKGVDVEKFKLWRERYQAQSVNKLQDLLIKAFTQSSPAAAAAASVASVPVNMIGSLVHDVPQYIGANIDRLTGGDGYIDPEGTINSKVQAVRDATMEMMGDDHPLAQFLYSTGMSMGESGFAMLVNLIPVVGPALSNAMFFSNAGVSAANDVIKNGGSLGQATATMVAFGAVELLTERFSLEKLKALQANGNVKSAKELFLNILKQGTTEGSEEVAATLADSFADGLINRDNSEFNRNIKAYMEQGLSREEAESRAWGDWWKGLAMDAAGGALSGAIFGGATSAANYRTGKQAAKVGNLEVTQAELADLAGEDNKEAVKTAEAIVNQQGVDKVLEAAKLSENEEVKKTAAHFEEVAKKSKLDEGDVAQLLVKASQAQIESNRFDAFAREMGAETRADYIEKSGKSAELLQNYDLSGAKLEEGRTAATSSFGAVHPNGVAAVDQNGKQVIVTGIDSSVPEYGRNDNTVSVVLSDGRTVDAGSVTFDNSDIQRLVNMAARFDSVGARALLANYEEAAQSGVGVDAYEQSFARLYEIAQKGSSFDSLRKNAEYGADIAALGENVARAAVEAGLADGDISSQTRSFFQKRVRVNGRNFSESKVHFDRDVKLDKNSDVLSVLQGVAEATGKKVVVTHALNTEDKGVYVNNTIYINADQAEHAMVTAALHEAVHNMRAYSEEDFRTLQKFVMNYLVASGQDVERMLASIAALYGKDAPDLDVQVEELVCKTVESLAANREALETALDVKQNKSIREKVGEILQKIADKVMSYFKGDKENGLLAHNRYAQVFLDDAKALQEMAQIVRQGFANAKANEREFGSKESGARYDIGISEPDSNVKKRISDITKTKQFKEWFGDWEKNLHDASIVVDNDGKPLVVYHQTGADFTVFDTESKGAGKFDDETPNGIFLKPTSADIGLKGKKQMALYANIRNPLVVRNREELVRFYQQNINGYSELKDALKAIDVEYSFKYDIAAKKADEEYAVMHRKLRNKEITREEYDRFAKKEGEEERVIKEWKQAADKAGEKLKAFVTEYFKKSKYDGVIIEQDAGSFGRSTKTYIAFEREQVKSATDNIGTFDKHNPDIRYSKDDTIYLSAVERGDMETAQRMVDEAAERAFNNSKIRDEDGKLLMVYHGSEADFTVFDKTKGRANMDIQGMFFSPWELDASGYGSKVRRFYLNITNPANESTGYRALNRHKGENNAGIKAREDLEQMGFDGVNNEDEEFIAFDSEQIKSADPVTYDDNGNVIPLSERFNKNNSDIRYSKDDTIYSGMYEDGDLYFGDPEEDDDLPFDFGEDDGEDIFYSEDDEKEKTIDVERLMDDYEPREAVYRLYKATASMTEKVIKGYSVKLPRASYEKVARSVMRKFGIREKYNKEMVGELADTIENYIRQIARDKKSAFSTHLNGLATACRKHLEQSVDYTRGVNEEIGKEVADYLHGMTILITPFAESHVMDNHNDSLKSLRRALGGYVNVGFEKDAYKYKQPVYMDDVIDGIAAITGGGTDEYYNTHSPLFPNGERPDSLSGWSWLENVIDTYVRPQMVHRYDGNQHDYYYESVNAAAAEMALEINTAIAGERANAARNKRSEDRKSLQSIDKKYQKLISLNKALSRSKEIQQEKEIERLKSRVMKERGLKELAREDLNVLKSFVKSDTKNFRAQYLSQERARRDIEAVRRQMAKVRTMIMNPTNEKFIPPEILHNKVFLDTFEALGEAVMLNNRTQAAAKMALLMQQLRAMKTESKKFDGDFETAFDKDFITELQNISDWLKYDTEIKKLHRANFSSDELHDLRLAVDEIIYRIENARKLLLRKDGMLAREASDNVIRETRAIDAKQANKLYSLFSQKLMNPLRVINHMSGFNENSELRKLFYALNEGQRKQWLWEMNAEKLFAAMVEKNEDDYKRACNDVVKYDYTAEGKGYHVEMTRMQALQVMMTWKREAKSRMNHMKRGGIVVADPKKVAKGKGKVWEKAQCVPVSDDLIDQMLKSMGKFEMDYMRTAEHYFNDIAKKAINETFMVTRHREIARSDYYIPVKVDDKFSNREIESLKFDFTIEGAGSYKHITPGAPQPILISSLNSVIDRHIHQTGKLYGLDIPLINFKRMFKGTTNYATESGANWYTADSVKKALSDKFGEESVKYIEDTISKLEGGRKEDLKTFHEVAEFLYRTKVRTSLVGNLGVVIKQAASYPTAGLYLSAKDMSVGLGKFIGKSFTKRYKNVIAEIDAHTAQHYIRRKGMSVQEVADMMRATKLERKIPTVLNPVKWIQGMDCITTAALWEATKSKLNSDYKKAGKKTGTDAYWQEVTQLYDTIIEDTQPMYDELHRSEFQKSGGSLKKAVFPFKTQPLQNMGILADAGAQLAVKRDKQSAVRFAKAVQSQVWSNVVFSLMTFLAAMLRHRFDRYRDEEDRITPASVTPQVFLDMMDNALNTIAPIGGSYVKTLAEDALDSVKNKKLKISNTSNELELNLLNDWLDKFAKAENILQKQLDGTSKASVDPWKLTWKVLDVPGTFSELFGMPYSNLSLLFKGTYNNFAEPLGIAPVNNYGELKVDHIAQHIINAYDSGNRSKGAELTRMWVQQKMSEGQAEAKATENVNKKLAAGLAQTDVAKQAMTAGAGGNYGKAEKLKTELTGKGFSAELVDAATAQALRDVYAMLKDEKPKDREEAESILLDYGFDDTGAAEIAAKWDSQKTNVYTDYQYSDAFNALKNGDKEGFAVVKAAIMTERQKDNKDYSEKDFMSQMKSSNHTKPLFEELEAATDGNDRKRLERVRAQLLNVFGSESEWRAAYQKYVEKKNK